MNSFYLCLFALLLQLPAGADIFRPAFTEDNLDKKASKTWEDPEQKGTFHELVAFTRPVRIGSTLTTKRVIRYLKHDAPYPGDLENEDHWVTLEVPPGQPYVRTVTFPNNVTTRALWLTEKRRRRHRWHPAYRITRMSRFFAERLHNITPIATGQGECNYGSATGLRITKGNGAWQNTGPIGIDGIIHGENITEFAPTWFVLSWEKPHTIEAVYSNDNFARCKIEFFEGPDDLNPSVARDKYWKAPGMYLEKAEEGRWISFAPVTTRGIRFKILSTGHPQIANIQAMLVLTDLLRSPVPEPEIRKEEPVPFSAPYSTGKDGIFTMVIDDPEGGRIKNIISRKETKKGDHAVRWNLKNEVGQVVPPGTYRWKGIVGPPIELRYEMCPYPNVNMNSPDNPPWECGSRGGWLADHNPAWGVATLGDRAYIGATGHEAGCGFLECTLQGKKMWQLRQGTRRMMPYGDKYIFCENGPWNGRADSVWIVNTETKRTERFFSRGSTDARKRGIRGMAPLNGKLYLTIQGDKRWLIKATGAGAVDMENCLPAYLPGETRYGPEANLRNDFLRIFRLTGTPPGKWGLHYIETTKGAGRKQHTLLAFKKPQPIGSLSFAAPPLKKLGDDVAIKIRVLKQGAKYPPNPNDDTAWSLVCDTEPNTTWHVAPIPEDTPTTRAILITFFKGGEDELADLLESEEEQDYDLDKLAGFEDDDADKKAYIGYDKDNEWRGLLEGMTMLRRRYKNLFPTAKVSVNSGTILDDGTWDAQRTMPISSERPGIYAMEWEDPQKIRGLAIKEIDGRLTEIDVYTGPDDEPIDIAGFDHWEKMATYQQVLRSYSPYGDVSNADARYIDGYADFGKIVTTRAVRLRIVAQWTTRAEMRGGRRTDRSGPLDPTRCHVYGVAPLEFLSEGVPIDPLIAERIEVWDMETKKLEKEIPFKNAESGFHNGLISSPDGELFATQGTKIVKLDIENGNHEDFVTDVNNPLAMTFDSDGNFYVYDCAAERKDFRVYNRKGKYLRSIGTPGGKKPGPWDPLRSGFVTGMACDKDNNIWFVDWSYYPKRTVKMSRDGKPLREFYGSTNYGGNGTIDPWDKTRVFYGGLEFEVNYETGDTRLKNLLWQGPALERPQLCIRIDDRDYMVNRPMGFQPSTSVGIVYLFNKDHVDRVAAFGDASSFSGLRTKAIRKALGTKVLDGNDFIWGDHNGDHEVQYEEIRFIERKGAAITAFNRDLGAQAPGYRYQVKEFLPNGAPVYERVESPVKVMAYRYNSGKGFHAVKEDNEVGYNADGEKIWSYPNEGWGVHSLYFAGPWHTGQVVAQFGWIGNETAHAGDLGEFVVINSNTGAWNIWTTDGLLAGYLLKDMRSPGARWWTMWEHDKGMILKNITAGQEHFSGYFCRSFKDDKYYIIMGGSSVTVAEVIGLDKFKRFNGTFEVTPENVRDVIKWELENIREATKSKVKMTNCYPAAGRISIDGSSGDWPFDDGVPMYTASEEPDQNATFWAAYDKHYLYVCYRTSGMGPFINTGRRWDMLFKTGAAVDLQIETGRGVDPNRKAAAKGDTRILMSIIDDKPVAVMYRPVAPDAAPEDKWKVTSPVFEFEFDLAKQLKDVRMAYTRGGGVYTFEAAIPLTTLGIKVRNNLLLKMDWGILTADESGNRVVKRSYWSNKATAMVSDAPTESRLHPDLWGYIRFFKKKPGKDEWMYDPMLLNPELDTEDENEGSIFDIDF